MINLKDIRELHVELTTKCQAACPLCSRNDYGYKTRNDFPITEMTIENWRKIFDEVQITISSVTFNGNFGDPIITKDFIEICEYSLNRWPMTTIRVHTNGGIRTTSWWEKLAIKFNRRFRVMFAIDGLEDTNHIYRINVPYKKVIENACAFINAGGQAHWRMIKFKHNQHQFEQAAKLSVDLGFKSFELMDQNRNYGFVFTSDTDGYWILPADETFVNDQQPPEKFNLIKSSMNDIANIEMRRINWLKNDKKLSCYTKERKSVYLSANGEMFPCCWIGSYPKEYKKWYNNFVKVVGNVENNALDVGFENAISWFNLVEESWQSERNVMSACLNCAKK